MTIGAWHTVIMHFSWSLLLDRDQSTISKSTALHCSLYVGAQAMMQRFVIHEHPVFTLKIRNPERFSQLPWEGLKKKFEVRHLAPPPYGFLLIYSPGACCLCFYVCFMRQVAKFATSLQIDRDLLLVQVAADTAKDRLWVHLEHSR